MQGSPLLGGGLPICVSSIISFLLDSSWKLLLPTTMRIPVHANGTFVARGLPGHLYRPVPCVTYMDGFPRFAGRYTRGGNGG